MKKSTTLFIAALLALALPQLAMAQAVIGHSAGNSWDLFVFGNGRVIYDVLTAIKLFMIPEGGDSGYRSLLILLTLIGFVMLAIKAGFDPGKNLLKLFTFIFAAWGVFFASTQLSANITVNDRVTGYYNTVERVPFVVGVPAALISQIGDYFTRSIETYFNYPQELKLTGASVGQFNLFGRMMEESSQYIINEPPLRNSLRAYVSDCVVPAIATGRFQYDDNGKIVRGVDALLNSTNLVQTLKTAQHNAIMTKYFPLTEEGFSTSGAAYARVNAVRDGTRDYSDEFLQAQGLVLSCADAWPAIEADIQQSAAKLIDASSAQWSKTGIQVPLESLHSSIIAGLAGGGDGNSEHAQGASPNSFVQQQSVMNIMSGAMRQSAAQSGNNEALTASLVSMAEQQQKSSWGTAFSVFNNMMGYVYTVLQAFIFAVAPLIIVAMLLPGMGGAIVTNYGQILIWLMLWQPMLAIINFIITLFGIEQIGGVWRATNGITLSNRALIAEKTNDLILAAQFLGTMTPLISWGIVKGALAFTEFIQRGVGSDVAAAAGASSAAGNLSMGGISMNNTSMNKLDTASSASVGFRATQGFYGAGVLDGSHATGLTRVDSGGQNLNQVARYSEAVSQMQSMSKNASNALAEVATGKVSLQDAMNKNFTENDTAGREYFKRLAQNSGVAEAFSDQKTLSNDKDLATSTDNTTNKNRTNSSGTKVDVTVGASTPFFKAGGGTTTSTMENEQTSDALKKSAGSSEKAGDSRTHSKGESFNTDNSGGNSDSSGHNVAKSVSGGTSLSTAQEQAMQRAVNANDSWGESLTRTAAGDLSTSAMQSTDMSSAMAKIEKLEQGREAMLSNLAAQTQASKLPGAHATLEGQAGDWIGGDLPAPSAVQGQVGQHASSVESQLGSGHAAATAPVTRSDTLDKSVRALNKDRETVVDASAARLKDTGAGATDHNQVNYVVPVDGRKAIGRFIHGNK